MTNLTKRKRKNAHLGNSADSLLATTERSLFDAQETLQNPKVKNNIGSRSQNTDSNSGNFSSYETVLEMKPIILTYLINYNGKTSLVHTFLVKVNESAADSTTKWCIAMVYTYHSGSTRTS